MGNTHSEGHIQKLQIPKVAIVNCTDSSAYEKLGLHGKVGFPKGIPFFNVSVKFYP